MIWYSTFATLQLKGKNSIANFREMSIARIHPNPPSMAPTQPAGQKERNPETRKHFKIINLMLFLYAGSAIPALVLDRVANMWWFWGLLTVISCMIQFIANHKYSKSGHENIIMFFCMYLLFWPTGMAWLIVRMENKNTVPVSTIPTLQNQTLAWCYNACPSSNNISNTCPTFNQLMYTMSEENVLSFCIERATQMCIANFANESNTCRNLWNSLNYALNNNDANTERDYRIVTNMMYGLLLSAATSLVFDLILIFMKKQVEKFEFNREQAAAPPATSPRPIDFTGSTTKQPEFVTTEQQILPLFIHDTEVKPVTTEQQILPKLFIHSTEVKPVTTELRIYPNLPVYSTEVILE